MALFDNVLENLPSNAEAEQFVLGAAMSDAQAFPTIAGMLSADDFSLEKHKRIFRAATALFDHGEHTSVQLIAMELQKRNKLEVGGLSYLAEISTVPKLFNLESYCRIVSYKAVLRRAIIAASGLIERCQVAQDEPGELLIEAERITDSLNSARDSARDSANEAKTFEEVVAEEGGLNAYLSPDSKPGIPICFDQIHHTLNGLRRGKLILLGARPATGKTAMASQIAESAAAAGKRVLFVTLEMTARDVFYRSLTGRSQVSAYGFRNGRLDARQRNEISSEANELASLGDKLLMLDKSDTTAQAIGAQLRKYKSRNKAIDMVVIDYLQLLGSIGRFDSRVQEVSKISRDLKKLSIEFDIPVLALSQLIRPQTAGGDEPQLHWLKESGQLEQDADQVVFLWLKKEPQEGETSREVMWKVAKNRDGMLNRGALEFSTRFCRFLQQTEAAA